MKVVCFSEIQWRYVRTRKQQVLSRFPADWEILFLSSVVQGKPNNFSPMREGRVTHVCVPAFKNFPQAWAKALFALPPARLLWNVVLYAWLRTILRRTGFHRGDRVFYVSNIYYAAVLPFLRRAALLYDCNDDHLAFPHTPGWARGYFRRLVRSADLAIAVSSRLAGLLRAAGASRVEIVGNGVDYDLFRAAADTGIPDEMKPIPRPVIGYSGAVAQWFDFELLDLVATSFPSSSIVMVGPLFGEREAELRRLAALRGNIHHLGAKPYERLGAYISAMDVCIIPLAMNELMRSADPNKIYEYAACGRAIVTMRHSDDVAALSGLLYVASTREEFVECVRLALASGANQEKLREFARARSWQARADEIASLIRETVAAGSGGTSPAPGRSPAGRS